MMDGFKIIRASNITRYIEHYEFLNIKALFYLAFFCELLCV